VYLFLLLKNICLRSNNNMIQLIQNFFHTDKWWGKTVFIVLIYMLYWCIFYGIWFLIPYNFFYERNIEINQWLFLSFFCLLIPIISFLIPHFIKKLFKINKTSLYILHIFLILLSIIIFFYIGIIIAFSHFHILG